MAVKEIGGIFGPLATIKADGSVDERVILTPTHAYITPVGETSKDVRALQWERTNRKTN